MTRRAPLPWPWLAGREGHPCRYDEHVPKWGDQDGRLRCFACHPKPEDCRPQNTRTQDHSARNRPWTEYLSPSPWKDEYR